eukprot:6178402-Pleurochrysis_carterae.AAC.3
MPVPARRWCGDEARWRGVIDDDDRRSSDCSSISHDLGQSCARSPRKIIRKIRSASVVLERPIDM